MGHCFLGTESPSSPCGRSHSPPVCCLLRDLLPDKLHEAFYRGVDVGDRAVEVDGEDVDLGLVVADVVGSPWALADGDEQTPPYLEHPAVGKHLVKGLCT